MDAGFFQHGTNQLYRRFTAYVALSSWRNELFVEPYGDIYPCNGLEKKYWKKSIGNIRETPNFKEIWEGKQAEQVRQWYAVALKTAGW